MILSSSPCSKQAVADVKEQGKVCVLDIDMQVIGMVVVVPNIHIVMILHCEMFLIQDISMLMYTGTNFPPLFCMLCSDWLYLNTINHYRESAA